MGTRVNLNVSHANQIYEVSRKDCRKIRVRRNARSPLQSLFKLYTINI